MTMITGGVETPPQLHALKFVAGCNTPAEVTRSQLSINIERNLPWLDKCQGKDKPLAIVAGGASLNRYWPELLTFDGDILALNNAYPYLVERGITPQYFMLLDARAENVDFLRMAQPETEHFIAAQCHPSIFDRLDGFRTTLYLTTLPDTLELTKHIDKPKVQIAGTVGTVGIKAMCMAHALGYKELYLYGYDSSYEGEQHHAFKQSLNDNMKVIDVHLNGKEYITTPTFAHQASEFCPLARGMVEYYGFDINLRCDGLLPDLVVYCNKVGEIPLEIRERDKYKEMWTHDAYRKEAPGAAFVDHAIESLVMIAGDSIIDFGSGTGRASAKFLALGYNVTSVDFADNCTDDGINLNFVQACLWELPEITAKFGYCTDVMEHIPTEKVQVVLSGIASCTEAAYFNIATRDDCLGAKIGRKLHMTVMDAEHWAALMKIYWTDVKYIEGDGEVIFIVKNPLCSKITA